MKTFLVKRWFLLLLAGGVSAAAVWPHALQPAVRSLEPRLIVAAALLLMAWGLESRSLAGALLRPWPALWAMAVSYGALPALAWAAGQVLSEPDLRLGLLIAASVPCTLASAALWTRLAGGNEAAALCVVFLTTATSWFFTTTWLAWGAGTEVALNTADMMLGLVLFLVVPVGLGQLLRIPRVLARAALRWKLPLGVLSRLLIFSIILKATVDVRLRLGERTASLSVAMLLLTACLCVGIHLLALGAGLAGSRFLGFDRPCQIAVAFSCSQKTLPVALFLFDRYFREAYPMAVVPLVFYHVGQLIVDTFIADALAGRPPPASPSPDTGGEKGWGEVAIAS